MMVCHLCRIVLAPFLSTNVTFSSLPSLPSRNFREKLRSKYNALPGYGVVGDTAFPVSGDMLGHIVTPLKEGDLQRAMLQGGNAREIAATNAVIVSVRQAAEWGVESVP